MMYIKVNAVGIKHLYTSSIIHFKEIMYMSELIKVADLTSNISGIYKINYPNGKSYIGLANDIKRRMSEHNRPKYDKNSWMPACDLAILKYGKITEIEILERIPADKRDLMSERERYWISYYHTYIKDPLCNGYNLTPGGEHLVGTEVTQATFTEKEVLEIRKRRYNGERKKVVYQSFLEKPFSTFEKVWLGTTYKNIGTEYLIPTGFISRQEYSHLANAGENNGRSKLTKEDVIEIRKRYDSGESASSIQRDYSFVKLNTISRVCNRTTWKNV